MALEPTGQFREPRARTSRRTSRRLARAAAPAAASLSTPAAVTTTATKTAPPSWMYPEDGNRFFPGTDASAQAGHLGGDTWVADAAIAMMDEPWSGMFVTLRRDRQSRPHVGCPERQRGRDLHDRSRADPRQVRSSECRRPVRQAARQGQGRGCRQGRRDPRRPDGRSRRDLRRSVQRQDDVGRG
jgi:hypothetical protein